MTVIRQFGRSVPQPMTCLNSIEVYDCINVSLLSLNMPSSNSNSTETSLFKIAPELLLSLATGPLLVALLGTRAMTQLMQELGQMSEEVFRGDRLPILDLSITQPPNSESAD